VSFNIVGSLSKKLGGAPKVNLLDQLSGAKLVKPFDEPPSKPKKGGSLKRSLTLSEIIGKRM
jgi:hypothetical protein